MYDKFEKGSVYKILIQDEANFKCCFVYLDKIDENSKTLCQIPLYNVSGDLSKLSVLNGVGKIKIISKSNAKELNLRNRYVLLFYQGDDPLYIIGNNVVINDILFADRIQP